MNHLKAKFRVQGLNKFKNWNFFLIFVFWILGIRSILKTKAAVFSDSGGYLVGNTSTSWGNISFTGESVRAWPTLLFYSLTNSLDSKIFLQTVLYLTAVSFFLLVTVAKKRNTLSLVTTLLVCIMFLSDNTFQWNGYILSESTTLSFSLIGLSFYILTAIRTNHSAIFLIVGTLFFTLASLVRAQLLISMIIVVFGLLVLKKNKLLSFIGIFSVLVAFGYVSFVSANINETWGKNLSQTTKNTVSYYFLTATETKNDALTTRLFRSLPPDAPLCLKSEDSRAPFVSAPGPYVFQSQQYLRCALGVQWVNENFFKFYSKFLLQNPIQIFESSRTYMPDSISAVKYADIQGPIPSWMGDFWETGSNGGVDTTPFYSWIFLSMFRIFSQLRKGADIRLFTLSSIWLGMYISLVVTYLFMNAETTRIAVSIVYPLIAIAMVIIFNGSDKKVRIKNGKRRI